MNSLYVYIINKTLKSDYFKAWVLAQVRHIITLAGTAAVAKGLADQSIVEGVIGVATTTVSFYLANLDVRNVDNKIQIALHSEPPVPSAPIIPVEVDELPPIK